MLSIRTLEFYSAVEINEILTCASTQMNLENITLSERCQTLPNRPREGVGPPDRGEGEASTSLCTSSAGGSSTLSSSGPHRLFRFLFMLAVVAGFPGAAEDGLTLGKGADEVGQAVAVGMDPNGVSGGDLRFSPRSGAVGVPVGPALAFRNSSSFWR